MDKTKEFVAGFDEEKEKLLELQGKKIIFGSDRSSRSHNLSAFSPSLSRALNLHLSGSDLAQVSLRSLSGLS